MKTIGRTIIRIIPVLILVSFFSSFYVELLPGDPAIRLLGQERAQEPGARELVNRELRLDENVIVRYGKWLGMRLPAIWVSRYEPLVLRCLTPSVSGCPSHWS